MVEKQGSGEFVFELVEDWAKLPDGWTFVEVGGVGVDTKDRVYVYNRSEHPLMVFDKEGNFLNSWGEGNFPHAHGVTMGPDDTIYLTDDGDHTVKKCTLDGKIIMTIGNPGQPAPFMSGKPFHRCTHVALDPDNGDIFVSDGYGNARVHKYSANGKYLMSWGESGTDEGEFNLVHNICTDRNGYVYVADRENHRVQVFDRNGKYETQWLNMHRPCGIYMDDDPEQHCYVAEVGPTMEVNLNYPNIGPRVSIYDTNGQLLSRVGDLHGGEEAWQFLAPHSVAVDSDKSMYVGEVSYTNGITWCGGVGRYLDPLTEMRSLQKFIRQER